MLKCIATLRYLPRYNKNRLIMWYSNMYLGTYLGITITLHKRVLNLADKFWILARQKIIVKTWIKRGWAPRRPRPRWPFFRLSLSSWKRTQFRNSQGFHFSLFRLKNICPHDFRRLVWAKHELIVQVFGNLHLVPQDSFVLNGC